jgi:hydrogenase/urease accessory protein HupE
VIVHFSQLLKRAVLSVVLLMSGAEAYAHEMTMADLTMREVAPKEFVWSWGIPGKNTPISQDLTPVWPEGCVGDAKTVRCGERGLAGSLTINGIGKNYSAVILRITWQGEQRSTFTLTKNQPTARLFGSARDERDVWQVAHTYVVLGIEHILSGIDHLFFVISLLLLVGFRRQLLATITLFTVAHSLTLAASALGALTLRPPPVEAVIALSIVLVSAEALSQKDTLTRQWPGVVAFVFGLIHGLGFAGALKEIGLPEQHANMALLTFNVGVEAGQLAVIALAWLMVLASRRFTWTTTARQVILYVIGSISVFWTLSRIAVITG